MRTLLRRFYMFGSALLLSFVIANVALSQPAQAKNEDNLCIPNYTELDGDNWETNAFEFIFVSRGVVKVNYKETGNCHTPNYVSSKLLHEGGPEFAKVANEELILGQHGSGAVNGNKYVGYVAKQVGNLRKDESLIEAKNWEDIFKSQADFENWDTYVNRVPASFDTIFKDAEYTIGFENNSIEGTGVACDGNSNLHLVNSGDAVKWRCSGDSRDETGAKVLGHFKDLEKFNIVFAATTDGKALKSIFTTKEEFNFTWCDGEKLFKNDTCNGDKYIDGVNFDQVIAVGEGTKLVKVKDKNGGDPFDVVFSGPGLSNVLPANNNGINDGVTDTDPDTGVDLQCEFTFTNPLSYFMCPLIELTQGVINFLDGEINAFLNVPLDYFSEDTETGAGFYKAWSSMRTIALVLLVLIGLVMVISQAISIGPFDAYTVKKVMPRLMIAVIGISLSWPLMRGLVALSNDLGNVVRGIIQAPFADMDQSFSIAAGAQSALAGSLGAALDGLGLFGALSFLATGAMAVAIAFTVLLIRQIAIALLAILAPIAIIAFVLPNTEKAWKFWWDSFVKALMMFPIIAAFIATGRVFAIVSISADNDAVHQIMAFLAIIIPYFMLPATFRLAGGALATIGGFANDRSRGGFDRLKKFRQGQAAKKWEENKAGTRFRAGDENTRFGRFKNRLNTGVQGATMINKAGLRPGRMKENLGNAIRDSRLESGAKASEELLGAKAFFANDDGMLATLEGGGDFDKTAQYLAGKGYSYDESRKVAARGLNLRKQMGTQAFAVTALSKLPGTGTAYKGEGGFEAWLTDIEKHTGGDKSLAATVIAAGKTGFRNAQQYEFSEAGFGDMMQGLDMVAGRKLKDDGTHFGAGEVGEFITSKAYKAVGASGIVNARNDESAEVFARAAQRDLEAAVVGVTQAEGIARTATGPAKERADREVAAAKANLGRSVAQIENTRDASGQGKRTVTDTYIETLNGLAVHGADGKLINAVDFARIARESKDPDIIAGYQQVKHDYSLESAAAHQNEGKPPGEPPVGGGPGGH